MRRVLTYCGKWRALHSGRPPRLPRSSEAASRDQHAAGSHRRARKDQNPAVRMKALESLRVPASDDDVRNPSRCAGPYPLRAFAWSVRMSGGSVQLERGKKRLEVSEAIHRVKSCPSGGYESVERVFACCNSCRAGIPAAVRRLRSAAAIGRLPALSAVDPSGGHEFRVRR